MHKIDSKILLYGYLCALTATLFWSGNFTVARGVVDKIPPISLAFWRWSAAIFFFAPFAYKSLILDWQHIKNNFFYLIIVSILGVSLFNTLIYIASHTTNAINLSLIAITFPIFILVFSRFLFHELITFRKGLGILFVITGITTLMTQGKLSILKSMSFTSGDLWMLLAAITFAIYSILLKKKPPELKMRSFQFSTFLIGLVFLSPFYIWESLNTKFHIYSIDSNTFYSILYLGLFASMLSYILWGKAVEYIGPVKSGIIYYTLPIFSGFVAYIVLGEQIESVHLLSMLLIFMGVLTAMYESKAA